jgi:transposase
MFVFSVRPGWDDAGVDRDRLKVYLEQGLSLDQMGTLEGKHPSTISYWLGKHSLRANGADRHSPKGAITRDSLAELVDQGLTLSEIGAEVARSDSTVRYWIRRYGLPKPRTCVAPRSSARSRMVSELC